MSKKNLPTRLMNVRGFSQADLDAIPDFIYIGRPMFRDKRPTIKTGSKWHNPFKSGDVLGNFEQHLLDSPDLLKALKELRGKMLGCWCGEYNGEDITQESVGCHGLILCVYADCWPHGEDFDDPRYTPYKSKRRQASTIKR